MSIAISSSSALSDPARLRAVRRTGLLDSPPSESFDRLTRLAAAALGVPVALVSLVDEDRQFFKSCLGLPEPWATERETPLSHSFCQHVVDHARPLVVEDARAHPLLRDNLAIPDLGVVAYAGFPLAAGGQILGTLCAIDTRPRSWTAQELQMLADIAESAVTEVRLRLLAEDAGEALSRLAGLQSITDSALDQLHLDELLPRIVERIALALSADTATVLLAEGDELAVRATVGLEEELEERVRVPIGAGFAGRVAAERRPLRLDEVDPADLVSPVLRRRPPAAMVGVPLLSGDETIGVLHVGSRSPREFGRPDVDLLLLAADRVGRAIAHFRRFEREHEIAQTLQKSALPPRIPAIGGFRAGVRYVPAGRATHVGGDWYDVFALGEGQAGVSVGDIAGHGIAAAAEMSRIRTALQAYLFESGDPADALERVDRLLLAGPPAKMATAVVMTLDSATRTARVAGAGHLPPILLSPEREAVVLDGAGGPPLGIVGAPARSAAHEVAIPAGATVLLYSDGLVERRDEPIDRSIARLAAVAASAPAEVEPFCEHILGEMLGRGAPADDVALLAVRCD